MVYVGKQSSFHTRTQDEIHELLCQFAQEHLTVVRLKGGDPYVFGRGGEELQYLEERGVQVHCVPGVLSPQSENALSCIMTGAASPEIAGGVYCDILDSQNLIAACGTYIEPCQR